MKNLSPTTQKLLAAFTEDDGLCKDWKHLHYHTDALAAALRALAAECSVTRQVHQGPHISISEQLVEADEILAIADELDWYQMDGLYE